MNYIYRSDLLKFTHKYQLIGEALFEKMSFATTLNHILSICNEHDYMFQENIFHPILKV